MVTTTFSGLGSVFLDPCYFKKYWWVFLEILCADMISSYVFCSERHFLHMFFLKIKPTVLMQAGQSCLPQILQLFAWSIHTFVWHSGQISSSSHFFPLDPNTTSWYWLPSISCLSKYQIGNRTKSLFMNLMMLRYGIKIFS